MVFGSDIAVVLRARKGRNILVQSHGLEMRAVVAAAHEVSAALEGDLASAMELLDAGVGVGIQAPLACGRLRVVGNRYDAVYRVVGGIFVIAVTRAGANIFAALNLVVSVTRLVCAECKAVDLTAARIQKRYAQVYMSIDLLVSRGNLDIVRSLADAAAVLEALSPAGAKARKAKAMQDRALAAVAAQQAKQIGKRLPDVRRRGGRFSFPTPPDLAAIDVRLPVFPLPELPVPDRPLPKSVVAKQIELEEDEEEEAKVEAPQPTSIVLAPKGPALRLREAWVAECIGGRVLRGGLSGAVRWASQEAKSLSASVPFKLQVPEFVERSVKAALSCARAPDGATRPGPEYGCFVADTLSPHPAADAILFYGLPATWGGPPPVLARLAVAVVPLPPAQRGAPKDPGAVAPAPAAASGPMRKKRASKGAPKVDAGKHAGMAAAAAAVGGVGKDDGAAAVAATVAAAQAPPKGPPVAVLATVQFAIPQELQHKTRDIAIDLSMPLELGAPRKADPAGAEWSPQQRTLRWRLGGVYPGYRGAATAALRCEGGAAAALAALPAAHAVVRVRGEPGETLSGVLVAQAVSTVVAGQSGLQVHPDTNEWAAFVLARPALYEDGAWAVIPPKGPAEEEEATAPEAAPDAPAAAAPVAGGEAADAVVKALDVGGADAPAAAAGKATMGAGGGATASAAAPAASAADAAATTGGAPGSAPAAEGGPIGGNAGAPDPDPASKAMAAAAAPAALPAAPGVVAAVVAGTASAAAATAAPAAAETGTESAAPPGPVPIEQPEAAPEPEAVAEATETDEELAAAAPVAEVPSAEELAAHEVPEPPATADGGASDVAAGPVDAIACSQAPKASAAEDAAARPADRKKEPAAEDAGAAELGAAAVGVGSEDGTAPPGAGAAAGGDSSDDASSLPSPQQQLDPARLAGDLL